MSKPLRFAACALVIGGTILPLTDSASAVSAEVAKKCLALTRQAFPPRVPGNPAAGSAQGSGLAEQQYYQACVAREGKTDEDTGDKGK